MTVLDADDWVGEDPAGHFSDAARRASLADALPLLATYFVSGNDSLRSHESLSRLAGDDLGDLLEFVQIRVLIAAASRLDSLLRAVLERPSFQYQREKTDSVGVIRGRLDTIRYMRARHEVTAPRRFPITNVQRSHVQPENVLAAWSALAVVRSLKRLPLNRLPDGAPERLRAERLGEALRRHVRHPALAESVDAAAQVWRSGAQGALMGRVGSRLNSGRVTNASAYLRLLDWAMSFNLRDVGLVPEDLEWVFYDETFDTKLFEIWCLRRVIAAIEERLGAPTETRLLIDRSRGPIAQWNAGAISVEVYFQAGLGTVKVGEQRWVYSPTEVDSPTPVGPFGGIPDITVVVDRPGHPRQPIILDPKLRQRRSVPGSEIYKILGYFGNLRSSIPNRGAIIFYGPGATRSYRIEAGAGEEILAVAVDPQAPEDSRVRFDRVADFILRAIPASSRVRARGPADWDDEPAVEEWVAECQTASVAEMLAAPVSPDALDRARKSMRSNLIDVWDHLDSDTQLMLATAEHFGGEALPAMDHSGPLLGLAAACERMVREFVQMLDPAAQKSLTFGQLLRLVRDAASGDTYQAAARLRSALAGSAVDTAALVGMVDDLQILNSTYRIPAAHADVVAEHLWISGRAAILVGPHAALPRILATRQSIE
mgnify:CR=1 FL=1